MPQASPTTTRPNRLPGINQSEGVASASARRHLLRSWGHARVLTIDRTRTRRSTLRNAVGPLFSRMSSDTINIKLSAVEVRFGHRLPFEYEYEDEYEGIQFCNARSNQLQ